LIQGELIWTIDKKGADLNVDLDVIVKITRSIIPSHCGIEFARRLRYRRKAAI